MWNKFVDMFHSTPAHVPEQLEMFARLRRLTRRMKAKRVRQTATDRASRLLLCQREEQLAILLASTAEGIYGIDLGGNCTFANRACARLLGYDNETNLVGRNVHECCHHCQEDLVPMPKEDCAIYRAFRRAVEIHRDTEVFWRLPFGKAASVTVIAIEEIADLVEH
jgi:PAS domain S-box-containing protein